MSEYHSHFDPLRPPTRRGYAVVLLAGPVLWIIGFSVVAWAADRTELIWMGLTIAAAAFVIGLVYLLLMRAERLREERDAQPRR
jgi:hypothetical protein